MASSSKLLFCYSQFKYLCNFNRAMTSRPPGFDSLSLAQGSTAPPKANGLRIYSMRFCPYAQRALLVLEAKQIPYEIININLKNKPDWFLKLNPLGKVPVFELQGEIIYESLICTEWLDKIFPTSRQVLPSDPTAVAKRKMFLEHLLPLGVTAHRLIFSSDKVKALEKYLSAISVVENLLEMNFYGGSEPDWVDYMVWPWMERLPEQLNMATGKTIETYPKLEAYWNRMIQRREVTNLLRPSQQYAQFFSQLAGGAPNYDLGISSSKY